MSLGDMEPRQKMINLMYLVLLCMLAMNVSKEILQSFLIINEGLERTTENFESKIDHTYSEFSRKMADDPEKVRVNYEHAQELKENADDIVESIARLKVKLVATADALPEGLHDSAYSIEHCHCKDNQDVGSQIMIGPDHANPWPSTQEFSALELKSKIEIFNEHLESFVHNKEAVAEMQIPLSQVKEHGHLVNWEIGNFDHLPLAATVTNLTRFQAAIRNSEADALKRLMSELGEDDFSFDAVGIRVIPHNGTYITQGDSFMADVVIAAWSTTKNPQLLIGTVDTTKDQPDVVNGDTSKVVFKTKGIPTYGVKTSALGEQKWGGVLKIKKPNGDTRNFAFEHKYMVAKPSLVVSPTKMNVFYKGLENPVDISVSGIGPENLSMTVSGCSVRPENKSQGKYIVTPNEKMKGKTVRVTVTAMVDGKRTSYKPIEYRIKPVPKPLPFFQGVKGSAEMKLSKLRAARVMSAKLEDFLFDLKYRVIGFEMIVTVKGKQSTLKSNSFKLTPDMVKILGGMKPGQSVVFHKIKAKMDKAGSKPIRLDGSVIISVK